jgi:hypothetical protein
MVPYKYFFRFCRPKDKVMLVIGTISLLLAGGFMPSLALLLGTLLNSFNPQDAGANTYTTMSWVSKWVTVIGCGELASGYIYYAMF